MDFEKVRANVIVSGRVQEVFYRANAIDEAKDLGLTGWIKNKEDGTVELVLEGQKSAIKEMILWCKEGTRLTKVSKIEVKWNGYTGEFKDFNTVRG